MSPDTFFAWLPSQDERYELVGGVPMMMAGAGRRHDRVVVNLISTLNGQLRGGPCQTFSGDTYIATAGNNRRMPDAGVDCGQPDDESMVADRPTLLIEVLSRTTRAMDVTSKLQEYQELETLDYVLLVDTDEPRVQVYSRKPDRTWTSIVIEGQDSVVRLEKLSLTLSVSEIYFGLEFRPRPKLVQDEADESASLTKPK
jgi:Uma2 family endonuclease